MLINEHNKISKKSVKVWKLQANIMYLIGYLVVLFFLFQSLMKDWDVVKYILMAVLIIMIIVHIIEVKVIIPLRYKLFNYKLSERHILIHKGGIFKSKIIIPIEKVYYVNNKTGPLLEKSNLENVVIGTLVEQFVIPCLEESVAKLLQEEILKSCELSQDRGVR